MHLLGRLTARWVCRDRDNSSADDDGFVLKEEAGLSVRSLLWSGELCSFEPVKSLGALTCGAHILPTTVSNPTSTNEIERELDHKRIPRNHGQLE